jgi:hypothetical protein
MNSNDKQISASTKEMCLTAINFYFKKLEKFYNKTKGKNLSESEKSKLESIFDDMLFAIEELKAKEVK